MKGTKMNITKFKLAEDVLKRSSGIAKTSDFMTAGLARPDLCQLTHNGTLERIRHGYYKLAGDTGISEARYISCLLPEGIICMESALFYYGYSDYTPRVWTVAVPRSISLRKLKCDIIPVKAYYIPKEHYGTGRTTGIFDGVKLPLYDRERTICDCFKYRTRLDNEIFNKAVNAYIADDQKNLIRLSRYAKEFGLFQKVTSLMEVLLNA